MNRSPHCVASVLSFSPLSVTVASLTLDPGGLLPFQFEFPRWDLWVSLWVPSSYDCSKVPLAHIGNCCERESCSYFYCYLLDVKSKNRANFRWKKQRAQALATNSQLQISDNRVLALFSPLISVTSFIGWCFNTCNHGSIMHVIIFLLSSRNLRNIKNTSLSAKVRNFQYHSIKMIFDDQ